MAGIANEPHTITPWGLTRAELRAIRCLARGLSTKEVAQIHGNSERTVEAHSLRAQKKMEARNIVHAAVIFDRWARVQPAGIGARP